MLFVSSFQDRDPHPDDPTTRSTVAPGFKISDLISVKPKSSYNLRSNSSLLLEPPKEKMLATLGARFFYAVAPCLWNSLPTELRDIQSLTIFKRNLKTHLFGQVFL